MLHIEPVGTLVVAAMVACCSLLLVLPQVLHKLVAVLQKRSIVAEEGQQGRIWAKITKGEISN